MGYDRARMPLPFQKVLNTLSPHISSVSGDIFSEPISISPPPQIFRSTQHNVKPIGALDTSRPIQTNNFYNNLLLDDQTMPVWTQPYSLWYTGKEQNTDFAGFAFNHTTAHQKVFGPDLAVIPVQFYFNPPRIRSFVAGAIEINPGNSRLNLDKFSKMAVNATISGSSGGSIRFPLVQGMGFITAIYSNLTPLINSQVGVQFFQQQPSPAGILKYKITLFNQVVWSMYVFTNGENVQFFSKDPNHIVASGRVHNVMVQFCSGQSTHYDSAAGAYPVDCDVSGTLNGDSCIYSLNYAIEGHSPSGSSLIWVFPHQTEAFVNETKSRQTDLVLDSTTKGPMTAILSNKISMVEALPLQISFEPWTSLPGFQGPRYSQEALSRIRNAAIEDIRGDVVGMSNIDSMYTSGKILDKFAYIVYVAKFILNDDQLVSQLLPKLKDAIQRFSSNNQQYPLIYDTTWKGIISSADPGADFGNACYNDHHFHYGYHIHACALIAKVDQSMGGHWLENVREWINTLIRDVANPSSKDPYFPVSRSFDFFHGHSFAHGIFASGDGKDEESSSEDYHFSYGMKLWAQVLGDGNMEARANLQLAIMRRSMNMYMLYSDDNTIQPANFIGNKVAGITFENKIDFSTYFGRGSIGNEWIHGIHMLPITPVSSFIRKPTFVKEEWEQTLQRDVDRINDGWKGILMLNRALFDPRGAYDFFSQPNFPPHLLDNGMSLTWSLTYSAGVGGF